MSDLISRADAIEAVASITMSIHLSDVICDKLLSLPSADAVHKPDYSYEADMVKRLKQADAVKVVRCSECKHLHPNGRCEEFADDGIRPSATDYCSYGERKGGEDE